LEIKRLKNSIGLCQCGTLNNSAGGTKIKNSSLPDHAQSDFRLYFKDKITLKIKAWGGSCGTKIKKQQPPGRRAEQFLNAFQRENCSGDRCACRELRN